MPMGRHALRSLTVCAAVAAIAAGTWSTGAWSTSAMALARVPGVAKVQLPPANGRFDYQIGGAYKPLPSVRIVDRDRTSHPAPGFYNICYINAFQTQAYQDRWWKKYHPGLLLRKNGSLVEDPGWPGEIILDTATSSDRHKLLAIEEGWLHICKSKGFNAVEPDNLDSNTRSKGLLTRADDETFAKLLVAKGHADGLAMAQKNDAERSAHLKRTAHFDFAIAEECQVYSECSYYLKAYGDQVYEIEYTDDGRKYYHEACAARGDRISIILRDREVVARGHKGYVYEAC
ncbi:MAG TPA: endo alpha-1,4 polygalactosaminidase [Mycobacteriales bacterium]|nr:endo alpha-1,4 polygalactosaminidase [Mycobacteriales bacterium]